MLYIVKHNYACFTCKAHRKNKEFFLETRINHVISKKEEKPPKTTEKCAPPGRTTWRVERSRMLQDSNISPHPWTSHSRVFLFVDLWGMGETSKCTTIQTLWVGLFVCVHVFPVTFFLFFYLHYKNISAFKKS